MLAQSISSNGIIAKNDIRADLESAVEVYSDAIFRYCYGILTDYHDAQDATQETFVKACTGINDFKGEASYATWLYRIAYNTCISCLRKRKFRFLYPLDNGHMPYITPEPADENHISEELTQALSTLSPFDKALVLSRVLEDMDYNQLSQLYGKSPATLRKRYERARKKLEKSINEQGGH